MPLDVSSFQSAFGRLCDLSARALSEGARREDVLQAFQGRGHALPDVQRARVHVNHRIALVKHLAARKGLERTAAREMVKAGRESRTYAEVEWMVDLPIVSPSP